MKILLRPLLLILLLLSMVVFARIYTWVDEQGITHISDIPPDNQTKKVGQENTEIINEKLHDQTVPDIEIIYEQVDNAFNTEDYEKAYALLEPLAILGYPRAQNGLGMIYDLGLGKSRNQIQAFNWYKKAAEQGYMLAQYNLGVMYEKGEGIAKDTSEAVKWYLKAAEQGHAFSQHNLALMYFYGQGIKRDLHESLQWEMKAAEQGDPNAQFRLGILFAKGESVDKDYNKSYEWFRLAAKQGYPFYFDFQPGWTVGNFAEKQNLYNIIEIIPAGDDIDNWVELLTIQNFPPAPGDSDPEDTLNSLKAIREKECPGITEWNVIDKDEKSILYEWQAKPCQGWPSQHEVGKVIIGDYNTTFFHYVQKTYRMSDDQRTEWINRLAEAK